MGGAWWWWRGGVGEKHCLRRGSGLDSEGRFADGSSTKISPKMTSSATDFLSVVSGSRVSLDEVLTPSNADVVP